MTLWSILTHLHPYQNSNARAMNALILTIFPLNWFLNFLYYTDPGSTFCVLFAYLAALEQNYWKSAMIGGLSILFRQTNIIWVCFILGISILKVLSDDRNISMRRTLRLTKGNNITLNSDVFVRSVVTKKKDNNNEFSVTDVINYDLNVLFVSLFSGKKSLSTGHHFSSPLNYFYDCLTESGLTNGVKVNYLDDKRLTRDFKLGIVTLVHRPKHRSKKKISMEEIINAIPNLIKKVTKYRPKFLCFNGKAGYEAFLKYDSRFTRIFVCVPTSGRVEGGGEYDKVDQVKYFKELNELLLFEPQQPKQLEEIEDIIDSLEEEEIDELKDIDQFEEKDDLIDVDIDNEIFHKEIEKDLMKRKRLNTSWNEIDKIEKEIDEIIKELQYELESSSEYNLQENNKIHDQFVPSFNNIGSLNYNNIDDFMKVPSTTTAINDSKEYSWIWKTREEEEMTNVDEDDKLGFKPPESFKAMKY
ncbi:5790_t:CDS:2 [Diversispora eburnea]|uniref:Dol-P-Glc:Glc(2)Man(9)GlcNAc(2)-PP-Dol alpha-1,2-glucosyltransferase n=1 Tax=Diversispora eburnea TaxID=1213867 RepID=A0A9N8ZX19_9GLOM|nr:5790_t:CDS:2 [Diversispora eburnea]